MMPFCVNCNKNIYISTTFCPFCGNMLKFEYYVAAEPLVRFGESHQSGLTEPPITDCYCA